MFVKKTRLRTVRKSLVISISALTALANGYAMAQEDIEQITITGSRIQRDVGFQSAVPVTALNQEELSMKMWKRALLIPGTVGVRVGAAVAIAVLGLTLSSCGLLDLLGLSPTPDEASAPTFGARR